MKEVNEWPHASDKILIHRNKKQVINDFFIPQTRQDIFSTVKTYLVLNPIYFCQRFIFKMYIIFLLF